MPKPARTPLGLTLARVAKGVARAFEAALAEAGGSQPIWLILISLKTRQLGNQRELAEAVGIEGATLTHHLTAMEDGGLITRTRDPENRRVQRVTLTAAGETLFHELRGAAVAFDKKLRAGLSDEMVANLENLLTKLQANVSRNSDAR
ncbi:MAG TPA: MarR family winged helix-turn-helix transcriptional regulator [Polyangiaceae bacterium]|nr:MarR family winged helix-turn-helix transcriptional regulator [Polyangiaceae bacterium]